MGFNIFVFKYVNSESLNMEIYYSYLYFINENKELLKYGFCPPKALYIYRDRVKNIALLKML